MALYVAQKVNASAVLVKDTNAPANPGYRLTNDEWEAVSDLDGDYNAQIALAAQYDSAEGAASAAATEQATANTPAPTDYRPPQPAAPPNPQLGPA